MPPYTCVCPATWIQQFRVSCLTHWGPAILYGGLDLDQPNQYLNQCWFVTSKVSWWYSREFDFIRCHGETPPTKQQGMLSCHRPRRHEEPHQSCHYCFVNWLSRLTIQKSPQLWARVSSAMELTHFDWNILVSAPEGQHVQAQQNGCHCDHIFRFSRKNDCTGILIMAMSKLL